MSHTFTIPYTAVQIPPRGSLPGKTIYSPILKTFIFNKNQKPPFSFESIVDSGAETLYFHKVKIGIIVKDVMLRFSSRVGFSYTMNTGLLGRAGFFDIFEEIHFNQRTKMFRLKGGDIKSESTDFIYE